MISWKQLHSQSVAGDDAVERAASSLFEKYGIPWMILTQWAGHWAQGSDQFVTATLQHLNNVWSLVQRCADLQKAAQTAEDAMAGLLGTCVQGAKEYVRSLEVYNRNQVAGAYYVPLWLWERLDRDRLVAAKKWRRYQRSSPDELQVDHLIPVGILEPLSEAFVSKVEHFEVDSERANSAMTINSLGNCALLSRGFNGAKNAKPLRKWLDTTSEFASDPDAVERWAKEMYLSSPFLEVDYSFLSWRIVEKAIADRAERIQRDLNNFIDMPVALHTALKNIGGDHFRSLT